MVTKTLANLYSLRKSKRVLRAVLRLYQRKRKVLEKPSQERLESLLKNLQTAILQKDASIANRLARQLEQDVRKSMPKSFFDKTFDSILAIGFALIVAILIRQVWFEPYTIPTGSMRPTLKEGDYLVVSKTNYGINTPLRPSHMYFDPSLVKRGSVVVFTGENMDIADVDTTYFWLIPGKKQLVKRLIGKPGDMLYFYGGKIFGINSSGQELKELQEPWFDSLEHIPFIRFDDRIQTGPQQNQGISTPAIVYQMNEPVAKLQANSIGMVTGEMLPQRNQAPVKDYFDLWGFKNYAMARLLDEKQVRKLRPKISRNSVSTPLYLELTHHPSIVGGHVAPDEHGRLRPDFNYSVSILPLEKKHIDRIGENLNSCRFVVKNETGYRYGQSIKDPSQYPGLPKFAGVPNGTYEMQNGKVYQVHWGNVISELPKDHPLYPKTPEQIKTLYNLGFEFHNNFDPSAKAYKNFPSRYAYFNHHDLYLMGAPIVEKDDPSLILFVKREYEKQAISTSVRPYVPFDDAGSPVKDNGKIDVDFLRQYGLKIPEKMYLVLGDNHAMSSDSRHFGFVPEGNLRGGVSFIFWPPGSRWSRVSQPSQPITTIPNTIIWGSAALVAIGCSLYYRRRLQRPIKFEL